MECLAIIPQFTMLPEYLIMNCLLTDPPSHKVIACEREGDEDAHELDYGIYLESY